eukprot:Em0083g2a
MADSSVKILQLTQVGFLSCAHETVKAGPYTAMNGDSSGRICANSNLTVKATFSLNVTRVSCVNVGGAYLNVEGSTNIYVAGTPEVTIVPTLNQLLINIKSVPPQATNLTYSIHVLQGNISISNYTVTNRSEFLLTNLIPNTRYTITVQLENCPNVNAVEITKCTLAIAPSIDVSYNQSGIPNLLTWADTGGCVQGYQVQLTTDTGSSFHYDVSRNECSHNCSIPVFLPGPFEYYNLSQSSITDGIPGPLNTRFLNGTDSTNLGRTYPLNIATPVCPNISYNYICSNTDTIPGITGGCVTKYRVRITTDDGSIVVDDNNVMSSSYLLRINETANQTTYRIQVYSITEDAVESAIGSGNTLPIKGSTATFELLWVGIAIEPLLAFVLAFLLGLCIGLKKRVPNEATNRQPPGSGMNPQRAERTEAAARSNQKCPNPCSYLSPTEAKRVADHFENVATVNKWATGEEKLKWLKVRLTGKAQTAFKKLPQDVKENYGECMKSLQRRFDPDSKRQLYVAELSARTRHKDEDWATFGDVLRVLADKAKARERLALNQFLAQIENAQVAFGVKQKRPTNVEEAVVATIELESYLGSSGKPLRVSAVSPQEPDPDVRVRRADRAEAVAAVSPLDEPQTVKLLGERLQRLEMLLERQGSSTRPRTKQGVATVGLVLKEKTVVPAGSEMEVMVKIAGPVTNGTSFVGHKSATCNGVMVANAVVSPSSNVVPVRILNPRDEMVVLKKGTQIASMELLEQDPVINISTVMKNAEVSLECQNILWDLVSKVGSHISESEREQLYSLLVEFADVFSFSSKDLGRTKELKHHIFTSDAQPVHLSPRRIPQARREELRGLLRDMLESDVIQQSDSPWSSPIVLAKKHDETTRFCVDYRKVNEITRKDAYPLPRVDDTLDTLVGSKFFTTLDLASGYWQVEVINLRQPSQHRKDFTNSRQQVTFLGHIVSTDGVATDPSKTEAVSKWPIPQNRKEVQQFLGLANYYRRFVKDFALISKPLQRLTEKNAPFEWTIGCQNAFDELRKRLVSSPVLAYPDYERRFILDTDASDVGIGAVLSQVSDCGSERVIAYASRSLTRPEQRQYLLGREFTLRTDHGSLVWIRNFKEPEGSAVGRDEDIESENTVMVGVVSNPFQKYTPAEIRHMQLDDTTIQPVHCAVSCGQPTSPDIVKSWSRGSRLLMQHWDALCISDGILWKKCVDGSRRFQQLVLPAKLQVDALRDLHQGAVGGHIGEEKMKHRLKERFYWPGCTEAVGEWCRNCISCTTRKTVAPKRRAPLQTIKAGYPMQIVSLRVCTLLERRLARSIRTAVPRGRSRKLHHPWKGPFKVMERLGETTYKIKNLQGRRKTTFVHFDRLKPCVISDDKPENTGSREQEPVGTNLDLVDSDDDDPVQQEEAAVPEIANPPVPPLNEQRRYPVRDRQRTQRYGTYVEH